MEAHKIASITVHFDGKQQKGQFMKSAATTLGPTKSALRSLKAQAIKDVQTVTTDGRPTAKLIEGVVIRPAVTHPDDRGSLCEIFNPAWGVHPSPLVYVYQFTIRPGMVKGWHVHHLHDDRIFISQGTVKVVLYDDRPDSPTYQIVNEIYRSDLQRNLMIIPAFVWHAHQNVGSSDALMISMPTRPYNHADPDVYRLPVDNDVIPYKFEKRLGW
ncbi:MAG TPA: dTDP-4-dehydrorhamnose 3,5-epimerase family protein [Gemmataceae bacterium]|nr:dTDP-4-dehydrorhamnose 3,5-epimerase family protein [Gemmataceae bacterium]